MFFFTAKREVPGILPSINGALKKKKGERTSIRPSVAAKKGEVGDGFLLFKGVPGHRKKEPHSGIASPHEAPQEKKGKEKETRSKLPWGEGEERKAFH